MSFVSQKNDFPVETFTGSKSDQFRQCLCSGYFTNVARRYLLTQHFQIDIFFLYIIWAVLFTLVMLLCD